MADFKTVGLEAVFHQPGFLDADHRLHALREDEAGGRRPDVAGAAIGEVAALVHVAAGDEAHVVRRRASPPAARAPAAGRSGSRMPALRDRRAFAGTAACAGTARPVFRSRLTVARRASPSARLRSASPVFMISELRPMKRQPAASNCQRSSPNTETKASQAFSVVGRDGGLPTAVGIVADVVIAGQIAAVHRQRRVQLLCVFEIVAVGRAVPADVAAVDDEIGTVGGDVFADAVKIIGQQAAGGGRGGCRKSGSGEIRACSIPFDDR